MIVWDTETTGLPSNSSGTPLNKEPHIIELAAIKLDDETLEEKARFEFLCKPPIDALPAEIVKITHITDEMLADKKPFSAHYQDLCQFFLGEKFLVAHNLNFDRTLLTFELQRIGCLTKFPWPYKHICTVEKAEAIFGHRVKLCNLYKHVTGQDVVEAHRAMADVETLVTCVKWLKTQKGK